MSIAFKQKLLALAMMAGLAGNLLVPWALSAGSPDYQISHMMVDDLGRADSPVSALYQLWLILFGWLIIAGSFSVYRSLASWQPRIAMAVQSLLILFGGFSGLLAGFFRVDIPGPLSEPSVAHRLHMLAVYAGTACLFLALALLAWHYFMKPDPPAAAGVLVCLAVSLILFLLFVLLLPDYTSGTRIAENLGLFQRMSLAMAALPFFVIANNVSKGADPEVPSARVAPKPARKSTRK